MTSEPDLQVAGLPKPTCKCRLATHQDIPPQDIHTEPKWRVYYKACFRNAIKNRHNMEITYYIYILYTHPSACYLYLRDMCPWFPLARLPSAGRIWAQCIGAEHLEEVRSFSSWHGWWRLFLSTTSCTMKNKVHVTTKYYEEMKFFRSNHVLNIFTSG